MSRICPIDLVRHPPDALRVRRAGGRQRLLIAIAIAFGLHAFCFTQAQIPKPTDNAVKATYLYNFARFVAWPTEGTAAKANSVTICVLGQDPFGSALDSTLAGETIGTQRVIARRISDALEADNCQILFISSSEARRLNQIFETLDKKAILTVSDIPQFSQHRGMIQFVLADNRIRFEVNLAAAQRAGLILNSELLKVAITVRKDSTPGD